MITVRRFQLFMRNGHNMLLSLSYTFIIMVFVVTVTDFWSITISLSACSNRLWLVYTVLLEVYLCVTKVYLVFEIRLKWYLTTLWTFSEMENSSRKGMSINTFENNKNTVLWLFLFWHTLTVLILSYLLKRTLRFIITLFDISVFFKWGFRKKILPRRRVNVAFRGYKIIFCEVRLWRLVICFLLVSGTIIAQDVYG